MWKRVCRWRASAAFSRRYTTQPYGGLSVCPMAMLPTTTPCYWSTLANGVRVISETTCAALACVALYIETGPRYEASCNNGVNKFIELMAYKGFMSCPREQFMDQVRVTGAKLFAKTTREYQVFYGVCPNENVSYLSTIFGSIVTELAFAPEEIACAKQQYYQKLQDADEDYEELVFDFLHEGAFMGTPLGQSTLGKWKNIKHFDQQFLMNFTQAHYQPYRLVLSVSSRWSHQEVLTMAQKDFGCMMTTNNDCVYWPTRYTGADVRYRNDDMPFAHDVLAVETPGYTSPQATYVRVLKAMMGEYHMSQMLGEGAHPRLALQSDISKLALSYRSFCTFYRDVGLLGIYFVVPKTAEQDEMIYAIQSAWRNMCSMMTEPEINRAIAVTKLAIANEKDGCVNSCLEQGLQMMYFGCAQSIMDKYEALDNMEFTAFMSFTNSILSDRCPTIAAVGPVESIPDYTRIRNNMYWFFE